jgi:hypothetical protein
MGLTAINRPGVFCTPGFFMPKKYPRCFNEISGQQISKEYIDQYLLLLFNQYKRCPVFCFIAIAH